MPLTILADDLTGACDTGALFTGAGPVAASTRQVTHSSTPSRRRGWTRHASIPTLPPPTRLWRISSRSSVPGGDILPDLGAATVGGLGMAPSGDIGDRWALFQPSHGTAPDIAGKGIANPLAMILSAAMLLQWLGDRHADAAARAAAERIERAVAAVLATGTAKTRDIGGSAATREVGDAGLRAL